MARINSLLVLLLLFMSCSNMSDEKKKIIFFGDSITEAGIKPKGYIDQIQQLIDTSKWNNQFELIGKGISGNKVYDLFLRLEKDVLELNPNKVIIWIGVNDVWHKSLLGTGTDTDRFLSFYEAIIEKLKSQHIEIYLCTPAVVGEKKNKQNELDSSLDQYSTIIRDIATKHQITLIDLRSYVSDYIETNNPDDLKEGILTYDGVHLNDNGNRKIAEWIYEKILP